MRAFLLAAAFLVLPWQSTLAQSNTDTEVRTIIERAITAQGGRENLSRTKASYSKAKGTCHLPDIGTFGFTGESFSDGMDQTRAVFDIRLDDLTSITCITIANSEKRFNVINGEVRAPDPKQLKENQIERHANKVTSLLGILDDKALTMKPLGESKAKDMVVQGIKVSSPGMPDIEMYFDKATGRLVKDAYLITDPLTNNRVLRENYRSHFKPLDLAAEPMNALQLRGQPTETAALLSLMKSRVANEKQRAAIDLLIKDLCDTHYAVREKASAALLRVGAAATGPLRAALKNGDGETVARVTHILAQFEKAAEPVLATATVRLLALRKPAGAAEALLDYLPYAWDETVAKEVKWALVSLVERDAKAKAAVEAALKGDNIDRKTAAAQVLGKDGGVFLNQPGRSIIVEGITVWHKAETYHDGRLYMEMESFDHAYFNRLDDALFAPPK